MLIACLAGTNITYPFKQEVIAFLDAVDPEAAQIGAVNTVAIGPEGRTTGYNFARGSPYSHQLRKALTLHPEIAAAGRQPRRKLRALDRPIAERGTEAVTGG